ncbi:MAG: trypsin-like peptidase domain-containing protein [Acidobacteriaceae bacterium]
MKVAIALALTVLIVSMPGQGQDRPSGSAATATSSQSTMLEQYDQAIDAVAERAMQSVVQIEVTGFGTRENEEGQTDDTQMLERQRSTGSGVIVDPNGYIVTNNHVVHGALRIRVILGPTTVAIKMGSTKFANPQRVYEAKLIGTNSYSDLAVIKIDAADLPYISLPLLYQVHLGQTVLAIGAPQGLDHTVTKGIVSAVGRQPEVDRPMVYVQTDAPINPGNSGGPLVDRDGNLIGINTFIYSTGGGSEGLGFAIPEPIVRFVYHELRAHGIVRAVTIGAHVQSITATLASGLKLPQDWGVIVTDVDEDSPASHAGLLPGDIVKSIDFLPVDSLPKYTGFLYMHQRGKPLRMEVLRNGKTIVLSMEPVDVPPAINNLSDLINPRRDLIASLGIFVIDMNASPPENGVRSTHGVIVAGILSEQPATLANLEVGDIISSANGKAISSTDEFRQVLASFKPGDSVVLTVERQSVMIYVPFELE